MYGKLETIDVETIATIHIYYIHSFVFYADHGWGIKNKIKTLHQLYKHIHILISFSFKQIHKYC